MTPPRGTRQPPRPARQAKPTPAQVQDSPRQTAGTLSYNGETYKLSPELGVWPLMQFARASEAGWRTDDPRGLAAVHAFLEDVLDPDDWGRFQEDMIKNKVVDIFGLMTAAQQAVNVMMDAQAEAGELGEDKQEQPEPEPSQNGATARPPHELSP